MTHAQSTSNILMVRPSTFRKNEETAGNNHYQRDSDVDNVHEAALEEFDGMVEDLRSRGVQVMVVEDDPATDTPDALFPNNWVSFHADGRVGLYPMFAPNRRQERREDILHDLVMPMDLTWQKLLISLSSRRTTPSWKAQGAWCSTASMARHTRH